MLWRLYINECIKTFSKWRTYIGYGALTVVVPLAMWGFSVGGSEIQRNLANQLGDDFLMTGNLANGLWASHILMFALFIHIPFLITLGAGDAVAGEGTAGTFRIYLTRPVSRNQVLTAKLLAAATYSSLLVAWLGLLSLGIGSLWLGLGDIIIIDRTGILILPWDIALGRFALAYLFAMLMMLSVVTLTFLLSVLVTNAVGPIVGTLAILIVASVLSVLELDALAWLQTKLLTYHFRVWRFAFDDPIPWSDVGTSIAYIVGYAGVFIGLSYIVFNRKDIMT